MKFVLLLMFGWAAVCSGQSPAAFDGEKTCAEAGKVAVPVSLMPSVAETARLGVNCSPLELYYGGGPDRFWSARVCGLALWQRMQASQSTKLDGQSTEDEDQLLALVMVFANGQGVAKNLPLARRFACVADNYVDLDRVLVELNGGKLDVCSDNYGRRINYLCLGIKGSRVAEEVKAKETLLLRVLPPAMRTAFQRLEAARAAFGAARAAEEPNGTTGAVQSGMEDELEADQEWLAELEGIEAGKVPAGVMEAGPFGVADKALNAAYGASLKEAQKDCPGSEDAAGIACTSAEDIRNAQRAWLKYREAWVAFGAVRWPGLAADKWRTWLTLERTTQLN